MFVPFIFERPIAQTLQFRQFLNEINTHIARSYKSTKRSPVRPAKVHLISSSTGCLFILLQTHQQLSELLLSSAISTASRALSAQINQFRNTLPAGSASRCVFPAGQKLLSFTTGLRNGLFFLGIIVLVEIINVLLGCLDGFLFLFLRALFAGLELKVSSFAPLGDYFGFFFVSALGGVVGVCACDLPTRRYALEIKC